MRSRLLGVSMWATIKRYLALQYPVKGRAPLTTPPATPFFPTELAAGIAAQHIDLKTYFAVASQLDPLIFAARPLEFELPSARLAASRELYQQQNNTHQEALAFMVDTEHAIGYCAGRMLGALDFLIDRAGLTAPYRNQGVYTSFLRIYLPYLTSLGYERVFAYCDPTNRGALIASLKAGFVVGGVSISDIGPQVQLLYNTHADRAAAFARINNLAGSALVDAAQHHDDADNENPPTA